MSREKPRSMPVLRIVIDSCACEWCGKETPMTGTKRCDRCWELERRIEADPKLARLMVDALEKELRK